MSKAAGIPQTTALPRLLGLYEDELDDAGNPVGWRIVGWALELPEGPAVTVPVNGPASATMWRTLRDAAVALDVQVDDVNPRTFRRWRREGDEPGEHNGPGQP